MEAVDLKSAYRSVPVHKYSYTATGLKWTFRGKIEAQYFIDTRLPMDALQSGDFSAFYSLGEAHDG